MAKAICSECGCPVEYRIGEDFTYCPMCENDQVKINLSYESKVLNNFFKKQNNDVGMNKEELKEMLKLYTKQDLWEFNQIKAKKQIDLMAQIKEQDQKISDLEAKLEESENELAKEKRHINRLKSANKSFDERLDDLIDENKQLKQQLAETDKLMQEYLSKCLSLEQQLAEKENEIKSLRTRQFIDMTEKEMLELKIATHNQDLKKIRDIFNQSQNQTVIAELEKVRHYAKHIQGGLIDYLDQQIRVLKGDK